MSTTIKTKKASYTVTGIDVPAQGPARLIVRQASGKARYLTRAEVGTARFNGAADHFTSQLRAERSAVKPASSRAA